jgi:hypothetical protein
MTTKTTPTAGARLRPDLDAALRLASQEVGRDLEFDEAERHVIDQAAADADRKAAAADLFDTLRTSLDGIADIRRELDDAGEPMPEEFRREILRLRQLLRDAGLSDDDIDLAPGLRPPEQGQG